MKHVVIVGAGLIGSAVAYRLVQAGARVTIVDRAGPAAGASGTSFGWINASFYADAAHHRLRAAGIAAHRALHTELPGCGITWQRTLWYEAQGDELDQMAGDLAALEYPVLRIDRDAFAALEPDVAPPDAALCFAAEGVADASTLNQTLFHAALGLGARAVLGCAVTGLIREGGQVSGVETDQGAIAADEVVIAAGVGAADLIGLPMLRGPGLLMKTNALPPVLAHVLVTPEGEIKQDAEGRLVMPTTVGHQGDTAEGIAEAPDRIADAALIRLQRVFPDLDLQWTEVALAYRPVPQDGLPVIGAVEPGVYACVMHSGVTLAAIAAQYAAQEVLAGQLVNTLGRYRPGRF